MIKNLRAYFASLLLLAGISTVHGALFSSGLVNDSGTSLNLAVPDGNPNGVFTTVSVSGLGSSFTDFYVTLNVSGGYNGDLYAYLSHDDVLVPLVNRVGVGSGDSFGSASSGFHNVTLSSSGTDIHTAGNVDGALTGSWQVDGRVISPFSAPASFDTATRVNFSSYNGRNLNGTWTLFIADVSSGGGTSVVQGWSLDITAVPEPVPTALSIFGLIVGVRGFLGYWQRKRQSRLL